MSNSIRLSGFIDRKLSIVTTIIIIFLSVILKKITHIRINIFPDGGIARLRVYGNVVLEHVDTIQQMDLIGLKNGGRIVAYSDAHFWSSQ